MFLQLIFKLLSSLGSSFVLPRKRLAATFAPQFESLPSLCEALIPTTKKWLFRPVGEGLEDRCLLANIAFIGSPVERLWSTPDNWQGGVLPGPGDTAVFNANSAAESIVDIDFAGGTLLGLQLDATFFGEIFIERPLTVTTVEHNAGSLVGNAIGSTPGLTIAAGGVYEWNGGAIEGASQSKVAVNLPAGTTMNIGGGQGHSLRRGKIISSGVTHFNNGSLTVVQGGHYKNGTGSTFFIETNATNITGDDKASLFELFEATLNKTANALNQINITFLSVDSSVHITAGQLDFNRAMTHHNAHFTIANGSDLRTWEANFTGISSVSGSEWKTDENLAQEEGFVNVASGVLTVFVDNFYLFHELIGPGTFDFLGQNFWWEGAMQGPGSTNIQNGSVLAIASAALGHTVIATNRTINNNGTTGWGNCALQLNNSVFNNAINGVFEVGCNESMTGGTFNNQGVFKKTAAVGGTTTIWTAFN
ncbi:MAG: hypothetical protein L0Y72_03090 [Gemmataceae bacterium]|nr:hypothetical protein [Gemmataceae bacterium]MCI0738003.1 hypothetical protein [Gemmataceae bacterium]